MRKSRNYMIQARVGGTLIEICIRMASLLILHLQTGQQYGFVHQALLLALDAMNDSLAKQVDSLAASHTDESGDASPPDAGEPEVENYDIVRCRQ